MRNMDRLSAGEKFKSFTSKPVKVVQKSIQRSKWLQAMNVLSWQLLTVGIVFLFMGIGFVAGYLVANL